MRNRVALFVLGLASIGLFSFLDDPAWYLLHRHAPSLAFLAEARLPSLLVCFALCFLFGREMLALPRASLPWRRICLIAAGWLLPTLIILSTVHPPAMVALPRATDRLAHLLTGLLAEELLFRGALQPLAARAVKSSPAAVLISAAFFSASHLQHHGWSLAAALPQLALTLGFGIALGWIAWLARSIWPAALVHLINNALALLLAR